LYAVIITDTSITEKQHQCNIYGSALCHFVDFKVLKVGSNIGAGCCNA
jgi:hypothetical protein